jgi:hypothetical protein
MPGMVRVDNDLRIAGLLSSPLVALMIVQPILVVRQGLDHTRDRRAAADRRPGRLAAWFRSWTAGVARPAPGESTDLQGRKRESEAPWPGLGSSWRSSGSRSGGPCVRGSLYSDRAGGRGAGDHRCRGAVILLKQIRQRS